MKYNWRYICIALLTESVKSCKLVKSQDFRVRELFTFTFVTIRTSKVTLLISQESENESTLTTGRLSTNIKSAKYVCAVFFYLRMDMRAPIFPPALKAQLISLHFTVSELDIGNVNMSQQEALSVSTNYIEKESTLSWGGFITRTLVAQQLYFDSQFF